ncbi:hypothetical protein MTBLM1_30078 [Rhodospirillaceae bacterium LM-1]|nr:hypothetical protein MTBLM1_30078 [Rhodospirillaceae bacterium LM-1]
MRANRPAEFGASYHTFPGLTSRGERLARQVFVFPPPRRADMKGGNIVLPAQYPIGYKSLYLDVHQ